MEKDRKINGEGFYLKHANENDPFTAVINFKDYDQEMTYEDFVPTDSSVNSTIKYNIDYKIILNSQQFFLLKMFYFRNVLNSFLYIFLYILRCYDILTI